MSEVIGVVSKIINKDSFKLTLKGSIILDRYSSIPLNTPLYLSQNISGKLVQDEPTIVSKIIGVTTNDGIYVNIQRGYFVGFDMQDNANYEPKDKLRYYTSQEIQDLITRIKNDIY
jgi:hypothetical protein